MEEKRANPAGMSETTQYLRVGPQSHNDLQKSSFYPIFHDYLISGIETLETLTKILCTTRAPRTTHNNANTLERLKRFF